MRTEQREGDLRPLHLIAQPIVNTTMCGKKKNVDGMPYVWAQYGPAHATGRDPLFCIDCVAAFHQQATDQTVTIEAP